MVNVSVKNLPQVVAALQNGQSMDTVELITLLDRIEDAYGFGDHMAPLIKAGGVAAVVAIATTGWPADGNVMASFHAYDIVVDAGEEGTKEEFNPAEPERGLLYSNSRKVTGPKWRSARRKAISCLSSMGHYPPLVHAMEATGLFEPEGLPAMLVASLAHVDYSVHNQGHKFINTKDQNQYVLVKLLNLATGGMHCSPALVNSFKPQAVTICKMYKDPHMNWIKGAAEVREALRAKRRAEGWDEGRIENAVNDLKERQQQQQELIGRSKHFYEMGGLDVNFVSLFNTYLQRCSDDEALQLVHEGGLIAHFKGCQTHQPSMMPDSPSFLAGKLTELWTRKAEAFSKQLYKRIEAEEAQAAGLRQQGNIAFKDGDMQQALSCYWEALEHNPQDYALFNNISFAALKLGDFAQACQAAREAIKLDPTVHKSWCRLGDAYKGMGRWQLAHLAYACALELVPGDEALQERQADVRSHLVESWQPDDVPLEGSFEDRSARLALLRWIAGDTVSNKELLSLSALPIAFIRDKLERFEGHTRYIASMTIRKDIEVARSLAVATGLVRPSALPSSCHGLKRPDQLPVRDEEWAISWTDTPLRHPKTGLVRHVLSIMSNGTGACLAQVMTLGTPGINSVRRCLLSAMVSPLIDAPSRPQELFIAHRLFPLMHKISELCRPLGIDVVAETAVEAQQSALNNDTNWLGYNHTGDYNDEAEDEGLKPERPDTMNGHKPE